MPQKILAGRSNDPLLQQDLTQVKVDQVILARDPLRTFNEAFARGLRKAAVETAVAYDGRCITQLASPASGLAHSPATRAGPSERGPLGDQRGPLSDQRGPLSDHLVAHGIQLCRAGIGFPSAVHLERFAAPARLAVTDDPRMAVAGGAGMLTLVLSPPQLADALIAGSIQVRTPRSVQVLLSGRLRPFVCIRDVALELLRRGLREVIERVDREFGAPVVVEFAGPSARLISVIDRGVLCGLAPQLGAACAVFVSDEKTEVFLRDQRRSKAHRALNPDAGAPCDDVMSVDLSAVDPLLLDVDGQIKPVRELKDKPVHQVVLGGDFGAGLRDILAAAALLKSKRVPPKLDLLFAPPSRQVLEVLSKSGELVDLIATGARLIEPDQRVLSGELYTPTPNGTSLRTFDSDPGAPAAMVASAETLAYAVAYGEVGDPRHFKRPVRITIPRTLPTDDVLVVRKTKTKAKTPDEAALASFPPGKAWNTQSQLKVETRLGSPYPTEDTIYVLREHTQIQWLAQHASQMAPHLRGIIAPHIPAAFVPLFAGLGVLSLRASSPIIEQLEGLPTLRVETLDTDQRELSLSHEEQRFALEWLAIGPERQWTRLGTAKEAPPPKPRKAT